MSNSEKILAAVGEVSDKHIPDIFGEDVEESEEVFISSENKREKSVLLRWGLAGCGLIAAVTAIAFVGMTAFHNLEIYGSLFAPKLTVIEADMYSILNCDEGFWAAELSELNSDNPWSSDMNITSMPVYKKAEKQTDLSREEMERRAYETAEKLGLTEPLYSVSGSEAISKNENLVSVAVYYEGTTYGAANVKIEVRTDGSTVVAFGEHWTAFSEGYRLGSEDEVRKTLGRIGENFNCLFDFNAPAPKIINEGRSRKDGTLYRSYAIFDRSGRIEEQILNFCYGSVYVSFSEDGYGSPALGSLTFGGGSRFEFMGNYPVISYEEAVVRLIENKFITEVPMLKEDGSERVIAREDIGRGELVYCTVGDDYRMPFYKFRVKIDSTDSPLEMTEYGLYYVPAVKEEYLLQRNTVNLPRIRWELGYGNGAEVFNAYNASEIANDNPWNADMKFTELPVYMSLIDAENYYSIHFDEEKLMDAAAKTAEKLGLTVGENTMTEPTFIGKNEDVLYSVKAVYSGEKYGVDEIGIEAYTTGEIKVNFGSGDTDGYKLPESFRFDSGGAERAALEYVAESFKELFGFENPTADIHRTGRNNDGEAGYNELYIYDSSEDNVQNILNYSLNSVRVAGKDERLEIIWICNRLDCAMNIGNYPIISLEEAIGLLTDGKFYGSFNEGAVQNGKMSEDIIVSAELMYRSSDNYYIPCYRFCVKLEDSNGDMEAYGAVYVPAVEGKYLVEDRERE